jgi:hypothetical protein
MAQTYTRLPDGEDVFGRKRVKAMEVTLDASYPAGGYLIAPGDVGMKFVYGIAVIGGNTASGAYTYTFVAAAGKGNIGGNMALRVFSGGTEVANATDLHTVTLRILPIGQ